MFGRVGKVYIWNCGIQSFVNSSMNCCLIRLKQAKKFLRYSLSSRFSIAFTSAIKLFVQLAFTSPPIGAYSWMLIATSSSSSIDRAIASALALQASPYETPLVLEYSFDDLSGSKSQDLSLLSPLGFVVVIQSLTHSLKLSPTIVLHVFVVTFVRWR